MPKNKGKGGKNRRRGKADTMGIKRQLIFKEDGQEYGRVVKLLGNCNLDVECADDVKRIGHIRGAMRKKKWVKMHDICLVSLRDFQDGKADIVHVYDADESRMLQSYGELPNTWSANDGDIFCDTSETTKKDVQMDSLMPPQSDDEEEDNVSFDIDEI